MEICLNPNKRLESNGLIHLPRLRNDMKISIAAFILMLVLITIACFLPGQITSSQASEPGRQDYQVIVPIRSDSNSHTFPAYPTYPNLHSHSRSIDSDTHSSSANTYRSATITHSTATHTGVPGS